MNTDPSHDVIFCELNNDFVKFTAHHMMSSFLLKHEHSVYSIISHHDTNLGIVPALFRMECFACQLSFYLLDEGLGYLVL